MRQNSERCSICCISYNHAKYIEDCIRSIWAQDYKDIEIVALDDGSGDDSLLVLERLKKISPVPMQIIEQENTGLVGNNFNRAFEQSTGDFVMFMSLDDVLYPKAVSEKMASMLSDDNIAFIANNKITHINIAGNIIKPEVSLMKCEESNFSVESLLAREMRTLKTFFIQGTVFRADVVRSVGGFDSDLIGDDIILRTKILLYLQENVALSFLILSNPACYYRLHETNVHSNRYRHIKLVAEYLDRYWPDKAVPKAFRNRVVNALVHSDFKTGLKMLSINRQTRRLLLSPRVWVALVKGRFQR